MFGTFSDSPRRNMVTSPGFSPAVATWYSSGWKVLYTLRSIRVTRTRASRRAVTACAPAKPPPRMITCGQLAPSLAGTVGRRLRNGITMAGSFGENGRRCAGVAGPGARRRVGSGWRSGGPSGVPGPAGAAPVAQRPDRPGGNRDTDRRRRVDGTADQVARHRWER